MLVSILGGKQQLDRTAQQYLAQIKSDASNTIQVAPLCSLTCAISLGPPRRSTARSTGSRHRVRTGRVQLVSRVLLLEMLGPSDLSICPASLLLSVMAVAPLSFHSPLAVPVQSRPASHPPFSHPECAWNSVMCKI